MMPMIPEIKIKNKFTRLKTNFFFLEKSYKFEMSPELKSNLLLSGISSVIITAVFYFWSKGDPQRPTVKTHAKVLVSSFGVNFCLFYALHKKMVPPSLGGCPATCGKTSGGGSVSSAPWSQMGGGASSAQVVQPSVAPNPAKFTAVDLNEPSF